MPALIANIGRIISTLIVVLLGASSPAIQTELNTGTATNKIEWAQENVEINNKNESSTVVNRPQLSEIIPKIDTSLSKNTSQNQKNANTPYSNDKSPAPKTETPAEKTPSQPLKDALTQNPFETLKLTVTQTLDQINPKTPSASEVNLATRDALVNILCTTKAGGSLRPLTGSGVLIDERGIILTNAHIGQYFLLKDYPTKDNVECVIRTGSPAQAKYRASLIYIPKQWLEQNAVNITSQNPLGTGENDFALLAITETTNPNGTLPEAFPYLDVNTEELPLETSKDEALVAAGYPAGFLGGIVVQKELYASSAIVYINEYLTYKENSIDLVSIGGSVVAQKGSSGGAVVRQKDGKLIGIIVTTTEAENTGQRDLRAITISYINRALEEQTGKNIDRFLSGLISEKISAFKQNFYSQLRQILVDELEK